MNGVSATKMKIGIRCFLDPRLDNSRSAHGLSSHPVGELPRYEMRIDSTNALFNPYSFESMNYYADLLPFPKPNDDASYHTKVR